MGDTGAQEHVEWFLILKGKCYIKPPKSVIAENIEIITPQGDGVRKRD